MHCMLLQSLKCCLWLIEKLLHSVLQVAVSLGHERAMASEMLRLLGHQRARTHSFPDIQACMLLACRGALPGLRHTKKAAVCSRNSAHPILEAGPR